MNAPEFTRMTASAMQIAFENQDENMLFQNMRAVATQWQVFILVKGTTFCFFMFGQEDTLNCPAILLN